MANDKHDKKPFTPPNKWARGHAAALARKRQMIAANDTDGLERERLDEERRAKMAQFPLIKVELVEED